MRRSRVIRSPAGRRITPIGVAAVIPGASEMRMTRKRRLALDHRESNAMTTLHRPLSFLLFAATLFLADDAAAQCHVRAAASGSNDGSSWANAYVDLQSALADPACSEIWVAQGVYRPAAAGHSQAAFVVRNGMRLLGGFAGTELALSERTDERVGAHPTVLSGDIDDNDVRSNGMTLSAADIVGSNSAVLRLNSFGVEDAIGANTLIDGFIVTAGDNNNGGGGLTCLAQGASAECSPRLARMQFVGNRGFSGGAMALLAYGGTIEPVIERTLFRGNTGHNGGAISANADSGGRTNPDFINVTLHGNRSQNSGGAMTFVAYDSASEANPHFYGVTITDNVSVLGVGGALHFVGMNGAAPAPLLRGTILWGNDAAWADQIYLDAATPMIRASVVQGSGGSIAWDSTLGVDGGGNIDADPQLGALMDNGGATPTRMPGATSAAFDVADACFDDATDQRGRPRPRGVDCDAGAVEVQVASLQVAVVGSGSVTASIMPMPYRGNIIHCTDAGGLCNVHFLTENGPVSMPIGLDATPAPGWDFVGWTGDCNVAGTVVVDMDKQCTATFSASVDLEIANDADRSVALAGQDVAYRIVASNPGAADLAGVRVINLPPTQLANVEWTCVPEASTAACPSPASGNGPLQVEVDLPAGSHLSVDLVATVQGEDGVEVVNTAEIVAPANVDDPSSTNNRSSASVLIVPDGIFVSGFEQGSSAMLMNAAAETARSGVR